MVPQKRPLLFLQQAERILAVLPDAQFLWIGDGPLCASWDDYVHRRALTRSVHRLPWQTDVQRLLLASDVFLHVAAFEGLPLAILEAMSAGLPCAITSNLLEEMPFFDETNALSIGPDEAWLAALTNAQRLCELGRAARELVETDFSYDTMAERYEALYDETLKACA
jgi:glycosyltransferase involved in cell wall biosynthesis